MAFHAFQQLPVELRVAIWKECLPRRIVELDVRAASVLGTYCRLEPTSRRNARKPAILSRVCRESRWVVETSGCHLDDHLRVDAKAPLWMAKHVLYHTWICRDSDVVHLNYEHGYIDEGGKDWDDLAIEYLKHTAMFARGASITAELICPFNRALPTFGSPWLMQQLDGASEYRVCLKIVNIHLSPQQALDTDFFGLMGEEVIKLIDARDASTIAKYHALCLLGSKQDTEARDAFTFLSSPGFPALVDEWESQLEKVWLLHRWLRALGKEIGEVSFPHDLLAPHEETDGAVWTPATQGLTTTPFVFAKRNPANYNVVRENAWVQRMVESVPRSRPTVMFRLCLLECWLPRVPRSQTPDSPP